MLLICRSRPLVVGVIAVMALAATSCAVQVRGDPSPRIDISASLPFAPSIDERINGRNDGTTFEPCTAYSDDELVTLGIDPATISDAGFVDSSNYRGCHWATADSRTHYSQILGNESNLDLYKEMQSDRGWRADRTAHGRTIGMADELDDGCIAVFMSNDAIIITIALVRAEEPSPNLEAECDDAYEFASLAASKAPL